LVALILKSREEKLLRAAFPDCRGYAARTAALIPFFA
jgi:protein-S-isoprenylcysteine O-methyltransferase Ste14